MANRKYGPPKKAKTLGITSRKIPETSGLYSIQNRNMTLYAGKTNNLSRRAKEHRYGGRQWIDRYLDLVNLNGIKFKFTPTSNPGAKERQYLRKIKKQEGSSSLPFNFTRGNTSGRRRRGRR